MRVLYGGVHIRAAGTAWLSENGSRCRRPPVSQSRPAISHLPPSMKATFACIYLLWYCSSSGVAACSGVGCLGPGEPWSHSISPVRLLACSPLFLSRLCSKCQMFSVPFPPPRDGGRDRSGILASCQSASLPRLELLRAQAWPMEAWLFVSAKNPHCLESGVS